MQVNVKAHAKKLHRLLRDQHQVSLTLGQVQQLSAQALGFKTWEALIAREGTPNPAARQPDATKPTRTVFVLWNHNDVWFMDDAGETLLFLDLDDIDSDDVPGYVNSHVTGLRRGLENTHAFSAVRVMHKDIQFLRELRSRIRAAQEDDTRLPDLDVSDLDADDLSDGQLMAELLAQRGVAWLSALPAKGDVNGTPLSSDASGVPMRVPAELELLRSGGEPQYLTFDLAPTLDALIARGDWKTVLNAVADMAEVDDHFSEDLRALLGEPVALDRYRLAIYSADTQVAALAAQAGETEDLSFDVAFSASDAAAYLRDRHGLADRPFGVRFTPAVLDFMTREGLLLPQLSGESGGLYDPAHDPHPAPVMYGAFLDIGEDERPAPLSGANVFIAGHADGEGWSYAPLGQHGGLSMAYLRSCTLISVDLYASVTNDSEYLSDLRQKDVFAEVRRAVLDGRLSAPLVAL